MFFEKKFEQSRAGERASLRRRARPWSRIKNPLVKALIEAYLATHEETFLNALEVADSYGCADLNKSPKSRLKTLESLKLNANVPQLVEQHLQQRRTRGERPSFRKAWDAVAAEGVLAPGFTAARKRVERVYREGIPQGWTGGFLLVGKPKCCDKCDEILLRHDNSVDPICCDDGYDAATSLLPYISTYQFSLTLKSTPPASLATTTTSPVCGSLTFEEVHWRPDDHTTRKMFEHGEFVRLGYYRPPSTSSESTVDGDLFAETMTALFSLAQVWEPETEERCQTRSRPSVASRQ